MTEKKILTKLLKIAKNQQKIITKLAQEDGMLKFIRTMTSAWFFNEGSMNGFQTTSLNTSLQNEGNGYKVVVKAEVSDPSKLNTIAYQAYIRKQITTKPELANVPLTFDVNVTKTP